METNLNNTQFYRTDRMINLSVGDFFLFSADGPKYVYLGRTPDNNFYYMRTDTKRRYSCRRNRCIFIMDYEGCLYFTEDGQILVNFERMLKLCASAL